MRLNPRNLIFLAIAAVLMVVLIVMGRTPQSTDATPTAEVSGESGSVFEGALAENINRFEVRELPQPDAPTATPAPTTQAEDAAATEEPAPSEPPFVRMSRDDEGVWTIDAATNATERDADQLMIVGTVSLILDLGYTDRFSLAENNLSAADFGLENPQYEVVLADGENEYRLLLGAKNPAGTRYYAQRDTDTDNVLLIVSDIVDNVLRYTDAPPYVPPPTATPTATRTPNPISEVDQTATAQVEFDATATAEAILFATPTPTENIGPELPTETTPAESDAQESDG